MEKSGNLGTWQLISCSRLLTEHVANFEAPKNSDQRILAQRYKGRRQRTFWVLNCQTFSLVFSSSVCLREKGDPDQMFHIFLAWKIVNRSLRQSNNVDRSFGESNTTQKTIVFRLKPNLNYFSVEQACATDPRNIVSVSKIGVHEINSFSIM